jgi:hypothetical protein
MRARSRSRFKKCELVWKSAHFEALSGKLRASSRFSDRCPTLLERFVLEPADLPIDFSFDPWWTTPLGGYPNKTMVFVAYPQMTTALVACYTNFQSKKKRKRNELNVKAFLSM